MWCSITGSFFNFTASPFMIQYCCLFGHWMTSETIMVANPGKYIIRDFKGSKLATFGDSGLPLWCQDSSLGVPKRDTHNIMDGHGEKLIKLRAAWVWCAQCLATSPTGSVWRPGWWWSGESAPSSSPSPPTMVVLRQHLVPAWLAGDAAYKYIPGLCPVTVQISCLNDGRCWWKWKRFSG